MGNSFSADSYIHQHGCSARNLTWQYIRYGDLPNGSRTNSTLMFHGNSTFNYAACPYANEILLAHGCKDHTCLPNRLDREFNRYARNNWEELGSPWGAGKEFGWWRDSEGGSGYSLAGGRLYWPVLNVGWRSKCPKQLDGTEPSFCEFKGSSNGKEKQTEFKRREDQSSQESAAGWLDAIRNAYMLERMAQFEPQEPPIPFFISNSPSSSTDIPSSFSSASSSNFMLAPEDLPLPPSDNLPWLSSVLDDLFSSDNPPRLIHHNLTEKERALDDRDRAVKREISGWEESLPYIPPLYIPLLTSRHHSTKPKRNSDHQRSNTASNPKYNSQQSPKFKKALNLEEVKRSSIASLGTEKYLSLDQTSTAIHVSHDPDLYIPHDNDLLRTPVENNTVVRIAHSGSNAFTIAENAVFCVLGFSFVIGIAFLLFLIWCRCRRQQWARWRIAQVTEKEDSMENQIESV